MKFLNQHTNRIKLTRIKLQSKLKYFLTFTEVRMSHCLFSTKSQCWPTNEKFLEKISSLHV